MVKNPGWAVKLGDVYIGSTNEPRMMNCNYAIPGSGACQPIPGTESSCGILTAPPSGLGIPGLATSDQSLTGQDGITFGRDTYLNRVITIQLVVKDGSCDCGTARKCIQKLSLEWGRTCGENRVLAIFPPCGGTCASHPTYGVVGRPRGMQVEWLSVGTGIARVTLRFDSIDHRLLVLDDLGSTDSAGVTVELDPIDLNDICQGPTFGCLPRPNSYNSDGPFLADGDGWVELYNEGSLPSPVDVFFKGNYNDAPQTNTFDIVLANKTNGDVIALGPTSPYISLSSANIGFNTKDMSVYQKRDYAYGTGQVPPFVQKNSALLYGTFQLEPGYNTIRLAVRNQGKPLGGTVSTLTFERGELVL